MTEMKQARAPRECRHCGRIVGANNLARHEATHTNGSTNGSANGSANGSGNGSTMGRPPGPLTKKQLAGMQASKAIGRYLDLLASESEYGRTGMVRLGRLEGFPAATTDPEVVEAAADAITASADEATSRIRELELRQRAMDLRGMAEELREGRSAELEADFVKCAAAWAEGRGISYAAFREMGVSPRVLKAAGINA